MFSQTQWLYTGGITKSFTPTAPPVAPNASPSVTTESSPVVEAAAPIDVAMTVSPSLPANDD